MPDFQYPRFDGMPALGLGTWQNDDPEQCAESVRTALEVGYRHVDTAQMYENEAAVGEGLAAADVPREDVFVATKVWHSDLAHDDVLETADRCRDRLGVDYLDLLYIHWPAGAYDPAETLPAFDELYDEGVIDRVGLSNFDPELLATAQDVLDAPVFANQVELHPFLPQTELREYCEEEDIELVAYAPLARGQIFENDTLVDVAERHDATPAQVSLAWLRKKGVTAIPKATGEAHIRENWESLGLDLTSEDVARIDDIEKHERLVTPGFAPWA